MNFVYQTSFTFQFQQKKNSIITRKQNKYIYFQLTQVYYSPFPRKYNFNKTQVEIFITENKLIKKTILIFSGRSPSWYGFFVAVIEHKYQAICCVRTE